MDVNVVVCRNIFEIIVHKVIQSLVVISVDIIILNYLTRKCGYFKLTWDSFCCSPYHALTCFLTC